MSGRRDPRRARAARAWAAFVDANRTRFAAAGLPAAATRSIGEWDALLRHGHFDPADGAARVAVADLTVTQYDMLVSLVESYFVAGYEYFDPLALQPEDRDRLRSRFGGSS